MSEFTWVTGVCYSEPEPGLGKGAWHKSDNELKLTVPQMHAMLQRDTFRGIPLRMDHRIDGVLYDKANQKALTDNSPLTGTDLGVVEDVWMTRDNKLHFAARFTYDKTAKTNINEEKQRYFGPHWYQGCSLQHFKPEVTKDGLPLPLELSICSVPLWRGCKTLWCKTEAEVKDYKRNSIDNAVSQTVMAAAAGIAPVAQAPAPPTGTLIDVNAPMVPVAMESTTDTLTSMFERVPPELQAMFIKIDSENKRLSQQVAETEKASAEEQERLRAEIWHQVETLMSQHANLNQEERKEFSDRFAQCSSVMVKAAAPATERSKELNLLLKSFANVLEAGTQRQAQQQATVLAAAVPQRGQKRAYIPETSVNPGLRNAVADFVGRHATAPVAMAAQEGTVQASRSGIRIPDQNAIKVTKENGLSILTVSADATGGGGQVPQRPSLMAAMLERIKARDAETAPNESGINTAFTTAGSKFRRHDDTFMNGMMRGKIPFADQSGPAPYM